MATNRVCEIGSNNKNCKILPKWEAKSTYTPDKNQYIYIYNININYYIKFDIVIVENYLN